MNEKATVIILKVQDAGNRTIIEADIVMYGNKTRERFTVPKGSTNTEIEQHIANRLKEKQFK